MNWSFPAMVAASGMLVAGGHASAAAAPSDAEIAHIAYTAGQIDIDAAQRALAKTRSAAVRSFAEQMVRDHKVVNEKALALVKKLGVTPRDNPTSAALLQDAKRKAGERAKLNGAAFDDAYIQNEITFHRTVNDALAKVLIPSSRNPELKALLQTGLTLFQEHQRHAEHVAERPR